MVIKIDAYFDITCEVCARSWSTDYNGFSMSNHASSSGGMGMATNKQWLRKAAYAAGWKCKGGKTLCPECAKAVNKPKCSVHCPYLSQCQEEYDDEPMGYCCRSTDMATWSRVFLGSVDEIRDGKIDCLF